MAEQVLMIALSPTMETGIISTWEKSEGDRIEMGDVICQVETDKATMEYESIQEGVLLKILVEEGEEAEIGAPIAIIGEEGEDYNDLLAGSKEEDQVASEDDLTSKDDEEEDEKEDRAEEDGAQDRVEDMASKEDSTRTIASPLAKKLADQKGLELSSLEGSGPGGRIIERDILEAALKPSHLPSLEDSTIPVTQKRRIIAERLAESKYTAPHYYLRLKARSEGFMDARKALNQRSTERVSVNAFIIKFVAEALKKHPKVNASWQGDSILRYGSIDIGLAVAQDDGLITPIIRNAANKGIIEIERELKILIDKAINNKLTSEDYSGATFTISNLGSYGIDEFTAIINPPGSAILALGRMAKEPVVLDNDEIAIQSNMTLTLSCDHRVVDGVVGAAFLKELKDIIEDPIRALY